MQHLPLLKIPAGMLLLACLPLLAQAPAGHVALNVVALDSTGKPVPDLTASDFTVFDNGARQQIVSLRMKQSDGPRAMVILFDLMNSSLTSRGAITSNLKKSLAQLPPTSSLYLYLLVQDGSLYPVHGLPVGGAPADSGTWLRDAGQLLDAALQNTNQLKPLEVRAASPEALPARFNTTLKALDEMRARMTVVPGAKELLWVTYGFPSNIRFEGRGWWDGTPFLRQVGARFVQSDVTLYTADPGQNLERGVLNRDALEILAGATGGYSFSTIDVKQAITQAQADARVRYSLEFQPSAKAWDGKYHKLRVAVARKGVRLQSENGYFAVSGS